MLKKLGTRTKEGTDAIYYNFFEIVINVSVPDKNFLHKKNWDANNRYERS